MKRFRSGIILVAVFGLAVMMQSQNPPAPTIDRVGFPTDYDKNFTLLYVFDRPDNKSVRRVFGNTQAASVVNGSQFNYPYDSVIVMESTTALQDSSGSPILDANGRFQRDPTRQPTLFVMKKGKGFGADYGPNRNGEWEYVAYRTDGTYQTTPQNSFSCAICHLQAGPAKDWVFRASLHFNQASGALPDNIIKNYMFVPGVVFAKPGSTITIYNDDVIGHQIVDDSADGFDAGLMKPGSSISISFPNQTGVLHFHCKIHPQMKGMVVVQ